MTQHITVVAQGGLCNRLRVVLSALCFSEETGCSVRLNRQKMLGRIFPNTFVVHNKTVLLFVH